MKIFLLLALLTAAAHAQVSNLYVAGGSYNAGATPAFAGTALYAHQLSPDTTGGNLYTFTVVDALTNTVRPSVVTTNVGFGIAEELFTIDGVHVYIPTTAGISWTGTNTGWNWATGVGAPIRLGKLKATGNWYLMPTARVVKSSVSNGTGYQPVIGLLFGWGQ